MKQLSKKCTNISSYNKNDGTSSWPQKQDALQSWVSVKNQFLMSDVSDHTSSHKAHTSMLQFSDTNVTIKSN